jgi:hypothetical protein
MIVYGCRRRPRTHNKQNNIAFIDMDYCGSTVLFTSMAILNSQNCCVILQHVMRNASRSNFMMRLLTILFFLATCDNFLLCQTKGEDFDNFLFNFAWDSTFQIERIKFPLKYVKLDTEDYSNDTTSIHIGEWEHDPLYLELKLSFYSQVYDNFAAELRDTDERVFAWRGIENGINVKYYFERIVGKWYLIKKIDLSD